MTQTQAERNVELVANKWNDSKSRAYAHKEAMKEAARDNSNPFAYRQTFSRILNGTLHEGKP